MKRYVKILLCLSVLWFILSSSFATDKIIEETAGALDLNNIQKIQN